MAQDLKKIDGNSLESIAEVLNAKFHGEDYKTFDRLRKSYPEHCKVIGIITNVPDMNGHSIWLYGLHETDVNAKSMAINGTAFGYSEDRKMKEKSNIRVVYCAYDKQGNYIGGLEPLLK